MDVPSPLLKLPPELQIEIADLADNKSLLALRLVNTEIAANTFEVFTKRFFTRRCHVATKHSLQVLRNITSTPQFLRRITQVQLVAIGTNLQYDEDNSMSDAHPLESGSSQHWCRDVDDAYGWEETSVLDDIFRNLLSAPLKHSFVLSFESKALDRALRAVAENPSSIAADENFRKCFGLATYLNSVQPWAKHSNMRGQSPAGFAECVLRVLLRSSYRPSFLGIGAGNTSTRRPSTEHDDNWLDCLSASEVRALEDLCCRVTDLTLDLDYTRIFSPLIKRLLSKMKCVRQLCVRDAKTLVLQDIGRTLSSDQVESIKLLHVRGSPKTLHSFLGHYGATCTRLKLNHVRLRDGDYNIILPLLSYGYGRLESLQVEDWTTYERTSRRDLHDLLFNETGGFAVKGKEQVQQKLCSTHLRPK